MLSPFDRSKLKLSRKGWQQEEKPKVDIVVLFERLTGKTTKRSGKANVGICPFHEDSMPSLGLYQETASFFCFACGAKGDAFDLIMKIENVGFRESLEIAKNYER